jgi:hypothetical protein
MWAEWAVPPEYRFWEDRLLLHTDSKEEVMRIVVAWILGLVLVAGPVMAGAARDGNGGRPKSETASNEALADTPKDPNPQPAKPAAAKPKAAKKTEKTDANFSAELEELRQAIQSQQEQLQLLKEELAKRDRQIDEAREAAAAANARAAEASTKATEAVNTTAEVRTTAATLNSTVSDLKASNEALKVAVATEQVEANKVTEETSPLQLRVGSAYITPVGFMDFTGVWRSHDGGSGIGTNFAGIPYGNNVFQNNLSEFRFSMQNSRIGFRVDAQVKGAHVIGYMESDYLGNNPGNVAVSSNSNTLRSRLYWVDIQKDKWEVLSGQTWSLITPGRTGISPLPGNLFYTQNIDVNYQLGLVWGRIPEFRFVYHPSSKAAFAVALDAPEQYVGGSAGGSTVTFPAALTSTYPGGQLNNGSTTLAVPNRAPDVIAKLALDPVSKFHFEVGGLLREFQLFNPSTTTHFSATGGAGFVNLNFELFKGFRVLTNNFWSDGGGRYIFGQAPDLIAHADGSPSLIHTGSTVTGIEYTNKNTLLYSYYGGLYVERNAAFDANGTTRIGYGYPGSPSGQNRSVQEGTLGFAQTFWKDPKYGALTFMGQYSYLTRDPWSVATGQPKNAHLSMVFLNLRYTLPGSAPAMK